MIRMYVAAPAIDNGAINCLFENLNLITANRQKITGRPEFRDIKISGLYVAGLYVGRHDLSIGDILCLWNTPQWHARNRLYYNIIGSPLSGTNNAHWYNADTHIVESGAYFDGKLGFLGLAAPALNYLKNRKYSETKSDLSVFDLVKMLGDGLREL